MGADSSKEESRENSPEQNQRRNQYARQPQPRRQEPSYQYQSPPPAPENSPEQNQRRNQYARQPQPRRQEPSYQYQSPPPAPENSPEQNQRRNQYARQPQPRRQEPSYQYQSPPPAPAERRAPYSYTTEHLQAAVKQTSPNGLERPRAPYNYNSQQLQYGTQQTPNMYPNLNAQVDGYVYVQRSPQPSAPPASEVQASPKVPSRPSQPPASRSIQEPPELPKAPPRPQPPQISTMPKIPPTTRPMSDISTVPKIPPPPMRPISEISTVPKIPPSTTLRSEISTVPKISPTTTLRSEISTVPKISPTTTLRSEISTVPKIPPTTSPLVSQIGTMPKYPPSFTVPSLRSSPNMPTTSKPSAPVISPMGLCNPPTLKPLVSEINSLSKISPVSNMLEIPATQSPKTCEAEVKFAPLVFPRTLQSAQSISSPAPGPSQAANYSANNNNPKPASSPAPGPSQAANYSANNNNPKPASSPAPGPSQAANYSANNNNPKPASSPAPGPSQAANYSANNNNPRPASRNRNNTDSYSCPTCGQRLGLTIYQCLGGHSSCKDCRLAGRACGTCLSAITDMRNISLEAFMAELMSPCTSPGCTLSFKACDMERHVKECPFGEINCPMGTFFGQCSTRCKVADLAAHFDACHREQRAAEIDKEMYVFNICMETHKLFLIKNGPFTFLVHLKVHENERKISMVVQLLGTKISAGKWTYEFHVYNKRQPLRKYLYVDSCQSIGTPIDEIFSESHCATLPLSYAMTFVNESALTYKFFIKKDTNQLKRRPRNNAAR